MNREFTSILEQIFGKDFLNRFKSIHPQGWVELINSFETIKKPFNGKEQKMLRVLLPWSFTDFPSKTKEGK